MTLQTYDASGFPTGLKLIKIGKDDWVAAGAPAATMFLASCAEIFQVIAGSYY